jgi:hypothetical protein
MALGLIHLNNKEHLGKLSKEELVDLVIDRNNELKRVMDLIVDYPEEELLEYRKQVKLFRGFSSLFTEGKQ